MNNISNKRFNKKRKQKRQSRKNAKRRKGGRRKNKSFSRRKKKYNLRTRTLKNIMRILKNRREKKMSSMKGGVLGSCPKGCKKKKCVGDCQAKVDSSVAIAKRVQKLRILSKVGQKKGLAGNLPAEAATPSRPGRAPRPKQSVPKRWQSNSLEDELRRGNAPFGNHPRPVSAAAFSAGGNNPLANINAPAMPATPQPGAIAGQGDVPAAPTPPPLPTPIAATPQPGAIAGQGGVPAAAPAAATLEDPQQGKGQGQQPEDLAAQSAALMARSRALLGKDVLPLPLPAAAAPAVAPAAAPAPAAGNNEAGNKALKLQPMLHRVKNIPASHAIHAPVIGLSPQRPGAAAAAPAVAPAVAPAAAPAAPAAAPAPASPRQPPTGLTPEEAAAWWASPAAVAAEARLMGKKGQPVAAAAPAAPLPLLAPIAAAKGDVVGAAINRLGARVAIANAGGLPLAPSGKPVVLPPSKPVVLPPGGAGGAGNNAGKTSGPLTIEKLEAEIAAQQDNPDEQAELKELITNNEPDIRPPLGEANYVVFKKNKDKLEYIGELSNSFFDEIYQVTIEDMGYDFIKNDEDDRELYQRIERELSTKGGRRHTRKRHQRKRKKTRKQIGSGSGGERDSSKDIPLVPEPTQTDPRILAAFQAVVAAQDKKPRNNKKIVAAKKAYEAIMKQVDKEEAANPKEIIMKPASALPSGVTRPKIDEPSGPLDTGVVCDGLRAEIQPVCFYVLGQELFKDDWDEIKGDNFLVVKPQHAVSHSGAKGKSGKEEAPPPVSPPGHPAAPVIPVETLAPGISPSDALGGAVKPGITPELDERLKKLEAGITKLLIKPKVAPTGGPAGGASGEASGPPQGEAAGGVAAAAVGEAAGEAAGEASGGAPGGTPPEGPPAGAEEKGKPKGWKDKAKAGLGAAGSAVKGAASAAASAAKAGLGAMGSFLSAPEHDPETGQQFVNIRIEIPKGTTASTLFRDVGNSAKKKGEGDLRAAGGDKPPEPPEDAEAKAKAEREKKEKEERDRLSAERKETEARAAAAAAAAAGAKAEADAAAKKEQEAGAAAKKKEEDEKAAAAKKQRIAAAAAAAKAKAAAEAAAEAAAVKAAAANISEAGNEARRRKAAKLLQETGAANAETELGKKLAAKKKIADAGNAAGQRAEYESGLKVAAGNSNLSKPGLSSTTHASEKTKAELATKVVGKKVKTRPGDSVEREVEVPMGVDNRQARRSRKKKLKQPHTGPVKPTKLQSKRIAQSKYGSLSAAEVAAAKAASPSAKTRTQAGILTPTNKAKSKEAGNKAAASGKKKAKLVKKILGVEKMLGVKLARQKAAAKAAKTKKKTTASAKKSKVGGKKHRRKRRKSRKKRRKRRKIRFLKKRKKSF